MAYQQPGSQLRVPKAAELLAARIRGQIIRSELKEGDALPAESELMERFGVSRPTLREAIRVLEMESQTLAVLAQTVADIIELQLARMPTRSSTFPTDARQKKPGAIVVPGKQEGAPTMTSGDWTAAGTYRVAPSVYRIPLPLPTDGLRAVNVYAIDHGDSLTLIDAGWAVAETTPALERGLAGIGYGFTDIGRILVTHVHRDHYSYAVELRRRWGTHITLGIDEADTLQAIRGMADGTGPNASVTRLRAAGARGLADVIARSPRPARTLEFSDPPDEWLDGRQQVALKDRSLDGIPTPGHTRGHVVFLDQTASSMFTGDHLLSQITPSIGFEAAPAPSPLASFLRSLAVIKELPDLQLLPAHGPVTASTHERADALIAHHEARLAASAAAVAAGAHTGLEVAGRLRWTRRERRLADLDPFNQMLAVLETVAHLTVLVAQGELRQTRIDGVDHYQA